MRGGLLMPVPPTPERSAMFPKIWTTSDEKAVLTRREMLGGIGLVGCAVAFPAVLGSTPAEALEDTPVAGPISDVTRTETVEINTAERNSETEELTEFSSQDWRRRRRRGWREVCTTHWRRGRRVRVCRRVY
jgi:hypothetical protein